jgi:hypothetical protein
MNGKILQYFIGGLLTFLALGCSQRKNESPFYIKTHNLEDSLERLDYLTFINNNQLDTADSSSNIDVHEWSDSFSRAKHFFENAEFLVIGTNTGEFGGSIIFSDKNSDFNYFLNSSHPLMVDFKNGYYYVTEQFCGATFGGTRILKIKDPTSLIKVHNKDFPLGLRQRDSIRIANTDFMKKLNKEIVLLDTSNVTASIFLPYKEKHYLIYSAKNDRYIGFDDEMDTTFLGEVRNGSLITLDTILCEPTWTAEFEPNRIVNGTYCYKYNVQAKNGLGEKFLEFGGNIFVKGDTIVIGHKHRDNRKRRPAS